MPAYNKDLESPSERKVASLFQKSCRLSSFVRLAISKGEVKVNNEVKRTSKEMVLIGNRLNRKM